MSSTFNLTKHAVRRMAQRNLSIDNLEYVLAYGERIHTTGITVYVLRKRDIPPEDRTRSEITRLEGTGVLTGFAQDGALEVITTYRNKNTAKTFRVKPIYDRRKRFKTLRSSSPDV
ncbi:MAG: hypothetical protein C3F07_05820 [Anaerolineales bacterium]|nr:DUF4258 domain-containing protein [Anaerolineae bacterium]PWB75247.1 MAG: hypothetical protein C3F07_05820 [Anaerolineales bacterium]